MPRQDVFSKVRIDQIKTTGAILNDKITFKC